MPESQVKTGELEVFQVPAGDDDAAGDDCTLIAIDVQDELWHELVPVDDDEGDDGVAGDDEAASVVVRTSLCLNLGLAEGDELAHLDDVRDSDHQVFGSELPAVDPVGVVFVDVVVDGHL